MKTILFVHQSADLYGSDRVLLTLLRGLDPQRFRPVVIVPCEGPLVSELRKVGIAVYILPLIVVCRATLSLSGLVRLPLQAIRSFLSMRRALDGINIDIVHSNTLGVLSGALWATVKRIPHVWHIHEIIVHPALVRRLFPVLLRFFADHVVCNSYATRNALLQVQPALTQKTVVIWNGIAYREATENGSIAAFRMSLRIKPETVLVTLVGRINRLKGQRILIEAASLLWQKEPHRDIHFLLVGSPPKGQEQFQKTLLSQINESPAGAVITLMDFTDDIQTVWSATDIAVVPSTEPESFGLVAAEAMAYGKPVIATDHGGVVELVSHNETGLLVEPGNVTVFAQAIMTLAQNPELRESMGKKGKQVQQEKFSSKAFIQHFSVLYQGL